MPRHIDVRVRVPVNKLGELIDRALPEWAEVQGIDRLDDLEQAALEPDSPKGRQPNGAGTAGAAILKRLDGQSPMSRPDVFKPLLKRHPEPALRSALYGLQERKQVKKNGSGRQATWELANG